MAKSDFIQKLQRLAKVQKQMPTKMGTLAVRFSKERFQQKNWLDRTRQPWEKRKRKDRGTLMNRTGRLKRSIRKIEVGKDYAIIGTNVPYAEAHNEGLTIKKTVSVKKHTRKRKGSSGEVKAHTRKMNLKLPERRFIGDSAILERRIERLVEREIKNAIE